MLESFPAWYCVFLCRGCKWGRDNLFFLAPSMRNVLDVMPGSLPCMVSSLRGGSKTILSKTPVLLQGMWETLVFNTIEYLFWFPFCFIFILQSTKPCKHYTCILTCLLQIVYDFIGANSMFLLSLLVRLFLCRIEKEDTRSFAYLSFLYMEIITLILPFFIYANHFLST